MNIRAKKPKHNIEQSGADALSKRPRGYGAMRDIQLNIDPRIDLTKPIYEQVLALKKADEDEDRRRK